MKSAVGEDKDPEIDLLGHNRLSIAVTGGMPLEVIYELKYLHSLDPKTLPQQSLYQNTRKILVEIPCLLSDTQNGDL
jgi:hypothetical protein